MDHYKDVVVKVTSSHTVRINKSYKKNKKL